MVKHWDAFKNKAKKWGKKWGKKAGSALLKYGVPLIVTILTGNVYEGVSNIAKDLAAEIKGETPPDDLSSMDGDAILDYLKGMDADLSASLDEIKGELETIKNERPGELQEIFAGWKEEFSEQIVQEGRLTREQMNTFEENVTAQLEKIERKLDAHDRKLDVHHYTVVQYLHSIDKKFENLISTDKNQLNAAELKRSLSLVHTSYECPECGGPVKNIKSKGETRCSWCESTFAVEQVEKGRKGTLTYRKLKVMSDLQINSTTMSSRMDIEYDPERFIDRTHITDIFKGFISILPESIGNLRSLKTLNLQENNLKTLPESIGNLTSLEDLRLAENNLSILPESITKLKSLKELYIYNNDLSTLPESIFNLSSLENLDLRYNDLKSLPESILQLSNLRYLNVKSNSLEIKSIGSTPTEEILKKLEDRGIKVST